MILDYNGIKSLDIYGKNGRYKSFAIPAGLVNNIVKGKNYLVIKIDNEKKKLDIVTSIHERKIGLFYWKYYVYDGYIKDYKGNRIKKTIVIKGKSEYSAFTRDAVGIDYLSRTRILDGYTPYYNEHEVTSTYHNLNESNKYINGRVKTFYNRQDAISYAANQF